FGQDNREDNWITVRGNAYLLNTAFANLIENNCKYSPDHHSAVTLTHHRESVHIRFSDTGPGIPKGELPRIFDAVYRGSSQGAAKGHGIGMTLAKTIIELHGGTIEVRSEEGEGTVFIVSLPHV
ncbi:MAG: HAMP domain-containing histidine kinase, partial [Alistipes sp.]|nr:HAMP domain-containing histidine kinase [Alistipes sp.]